MQEGGRLVDRPRYTSDRTFSPFPFPDPSNALVAKIRNLGEQLDAHRKSRQTEHPELTVTSMYNVLLKVRAASALSNEEKDTYRKGLVGLLKKIHDQLDAAVVSAYGWPASVSSPEMVQYLSAINAQRYAEEQQGIVRYIERNGVNRYLPEHARSLSDVVSANRNIGTSAWPEKLLEQFSVLRRFMTRARSWDLMQVLAVFEKPDEREVEAALDSLVALGLLVAHGTGDERRWTGVDRLASIKPSRRLGATG